MVDFVNEALRAIGEECEGVVDFAFHVIGAGYRPARVCLFEVPPRAG
jgi:hypothetical protein